MRRVIFVFLLVALVSPVAATGERVATAKAPKTVLAVQESKQGDLLVRMDVTSFRPSSKRLRLGGLAGYRGWSFSPDGRRLAIGVDRLHGFRIVDVRRLKSVGRVQTWSEGISVLAWLAPRRIVGYEPAGFFAVDPVTRKQLAPPDLVGFVQAFARVGDELVVALAPSAWEVGPARLAVLDGAGNVRSVALDGIKAGTRWEWETMRGESYLPGLAVDAAGRAFVVGGRDEPVAEVDLKTLAVTYHRPRAPASLLSRFHNWLEPAAEAKLPLLGNFRKALWLGEGRIAVWGTDSEPSGPDRVQTTLVGLSVIDTHDWTRRMVDPDATAGALTEGVLLASHNYPSGLTAYSSSGKRLYHVFDGEDAGAVATFGPRVFVSSRNAPIRIVDAATGKFLGSRRDVPRILHADFRWAY